MPAQNSISVEQMRGALRRLYRNDPESNLLATIARVLSDPLRPVDEKGGWKQNPLLTVLFLLACALMGVFFYFSIRGTR